MSVSKWAWREECDKDYCPGDCDNCPKADEEDEVWKDIDGFKGLYQVSNYGNVRGLLFTNNKVSKPKIHDIAKCDNGNGYYNVHLRKDGKKFVRYIHRLVAEAFCKNPDGKHYVNHLDCNKHNNNAENLEWCSQKENVEYSRDRMMHAKNSRTGESGHKYIRFRKSSWWVHIRALNRQINIEKRFDTLEEAIRFRDNSLRSIGYGI